jgi:hypothetical protein
MATSDKSTGDVINLEDGGEFDHWGIVLWSI